MALLLVLSIIAIAACSAPPPTATPEPPTATPDIDATVEARVRSEREAEKRILAVLQTEFPSPTPEPPPTPDIPATVQAVMAEAMPTATPRPTATPTFNQWLQRELSTLECDDPGDKLTWENAKRTHPYSADFWCVIPTATPRPTPTPRPTATPRPTSTPKPTATPRPRATPTFNQWLQREMSTLECADPRDKLTWENVRRTQPYSADFWCVSPTPTPRPTATRRPTPTPRPTIQQVPQDRESRLAAITVLVTTSDGSGTGFFAVTEDKGRWYVFTNEHVTQGDETVEVYWHLARETVEADVLKSNANLDIAILDVQPSDFGSYPSGWGGFSYGSKNYDKGDEVWIAGYPGDMGVRRGKSPVVRDGTIYQKSLQRYEGGTSFIEHSVKTAPGSSGSPVVNSSDQIIAINAGGATEAERIGLAVPLWAIYRWLKTGEEPGPAYGRLTQSDGSYWAVLAWEESGLQKAMTTPQGNFCVTQIWESDLDDGSKWYRWRDLCESGLEGIQGEDGEIYFEYSGTTYHAPMISLAEEPS